MTKELQVKSASADYPIYIGAGILENLSDYLAPMAHQRKIIVSDDNVAELYLDAVCNYANIPQQDTIVFPHGENSKSLRTCESVYQKLLEKEITRDSVLIALGGGVVGDLTGFVAATYLRGIDYVQLPTSLLAQVDSAVGGKTAVNHHIGKNMIGAFHHPKVVISDTETLKTLPQREYISAFAEIIKYGLILDEAFFTWLETNINALQEYDERTLAYAISESCRIKAQVVSADEFERSGQRALLNLGHTFGHAIESCLGYGEWLHGEAVGYGMILAVEFSLKKQLIDEQVARRMRNLIERAGLPNALPSSISLECLLRTMRIDKKNSQARQRLILLKGIGCAFIDDTWSPQDIKKTLSENIRH